MPIVIEGRTLPCVCGSNPAQGMDCICDSIASEAQRHAGIYAAAFIATREQLRRQRQDTIKATGYPAFPPDREDNVAHRIAQSVLDAYIADDRQYNEEICRKLGCCAAPPLGSNYCTDHDPEPKGAPA